MKDQTFGHLALSENGFLFDTSTGFTYSLNSPGTFILRNLISGETTEAVLEKLTAQFDVTGEIAEHDLEQFVNRLKEMGLLPR